MSVKPTIVVVTIPINHNQEKLDELNAGLGTNFKTTDVHIDDLHDTLDDMIRACGDDNGWYIGDRINVSISVDYQHEDK